jgi:NAD(P)H-flavin reductase
MSTTSQHPMPPGRTPWAILPVRVQRIVYEAPQVATYDLEFCDPQHARHYRSTAGQFNMLYVPGVGEAAISIAGHEPARGLLRHTIRHVGRVTEAIARGGVGLQLGLRGPFGNPWPLDDLLSATTSTSLTPTHSAGAHSASTSPSVAQVIVVAGGLGLAPLRSSIVQLSGQPSTAERTHVLIGARTPADLLYESEHALWRSCGLDIQVTVDRGHSAWRGPVGVVTLLLQRLAIPEPRQVRLLTCGPEVMMRYVASTAMERGIPPEHIWVSLERNMNCAIGLCGHCQLGPAFICKDGPVFPYRRVRDWLRVQEL